MNTGLYYKVMKALESVAVYIFGMPDMWIMALIIVVLLDYITGFCKDYIKRQLSSAAGLIGIVKKVMLFSVVAVAVVVDNIMNAGGRIRIAIIVFMIANTALSVLENCVEAGLPVPQFLIKLIEKLKNSSVDTE